MLSDTSSSLLQRFRSQADSSAWRSLSDLYRPLLRAWVRPQVRQENDAEDVVQDVLVVILEKLPTFEHNGRMGAFRSWLRNITRNCLHRFFDAHRHHSQSIDAGQFDAVLVELEDPESEVSRRWDEQHDLHVIQQLLAWVEPQFESSTWRAFAATGLDGRPVDEVAAELGMTKNAVYVARSRVLTRLRHEARGLLD